MIRTPLLPQSLKLPWGNSEEGRSLWTWSKGTQLRTSCKDLVISGALSPGALQWAPIPLPHPCPGDTVLAASLPHPRARAGCFYSFSLSCAVRKCQLDPFFLPVLQTRAAKNAGSADCSKFRISSFKRPALFKHNDNKNNNNYSYHGCQAHSGQAFTCTVLYKSHQGLVAAIIFSFLIWTVSPNLHGYEWQGWKGNLCFQSSKLTPPLSIYMFFISLLILSPFKKIWSN